MDRIVEVLLEKESMVSAAEVVLVVLPGTRLRARRGPCSPRPPRRWLAGACGPRHAPLPSSCAPPLLLAHSPCHLRVPAPPCSHPQTGDEFRALLSQFATIPAENVEAVARQKQPDAELQLA